MRVSSAPCTPLNPPILFPKWQKKQECIPVGCVPNAHWLYAMAVVSARGACVAHPPSMHAPLPCTPPDMHTPCHVCPCHTCPPPCMSPVMHAPLPHMPPTMHTPCHACPPLPCTSPFHACHPCHACPSLPHPPTTHAPPVDRILDTRFWKYYLAPTSLRAVKKKANGLRFCFSCY